jgi:hypothetical protein
MADMVCDQNFLGRNGAKWDETDFARMTAPKLADMVCLEFSVNVTAPGVARRTGCRLAIVLDSAATDRLSPCGHA